MQSSLGSHFAAALALGTLSLATACSTPTKMTDVWKDPSYNGGTLKNLVVFGGRVSEADRHTLEDSFVNALQMHGVRATPSYRMFPGALPTKDDARNALQQGGYDGALVSSLRSVTEKPTFVGGAPMGFWDNYYGPGWGAAYYGDGYAVTEPVVNFESSLWDLQNQAGRLVWTAMTKTDNPSSAKDFASSLTNDVVPALTKAGLIGPVTGNAVSQATRPPPH